MPAYCLDLHIVHYYSMESRYNALHVYVIQGTQTLEIRSIIVQEVKGIFKSNFAFFAQWYPSKGFVPSSETFLKVLSSEI